MASFVSSSSSFDGSSSSNNMTAPTQESSGSSFDSSSPPGNPLQTPPLGTKATALVNSKKGLTRNRSPHRTKTKRSHKRSPKPKQKVQDEIGESMTLLLNQNPDFHFATSRREQPQTEEQTKQMIPKSRKRGRTDGRHIVISNEDGHDLHHLFFDWEDSSLSTFWPLFGPQNRYRCQVLTKCGWILIRNFRPHRDLPSGFRKLRNYLFQRPPERVLKDPPLVQALRFLLVMAGLILLGCLTLSTGAAFAVMYAWRFGKLVVFVVSSLVVDWSEIASICPWWLLSVADKILWLVIQFDRVVLFGNRWRGREWNKGSFDFTDSIYRDNSNRPLSSAKDQYLWKLPPPDALTRSSKMIPNEGVTPRNSNTAASSGSFAPINPKQELKSARDGNFWRKYTALHIEAIDYCYIMLREEFIRRQYTKLKRRKAAFHEEETNNSIQDSRDDLRRRASSVASLENFRQEFVLNPSTNNIDRKEIDEVTGMSIKLQDLLESDDSFDDDCDSNAPVEVQNTTLDSTKAVFHRDNDNETIGSGSDGTAIDMPWMDVGTEIGMKLLGSSAVQKAMASHDTVDKITSLKEQMDNHFKKDTSNKSMSFATDESFNRGDSCPPTPFYDAEREPLSFNVSSPGVSGSKAGTESENRAALGYRLDPYVPVNPMWTSAAAAAVSPAQSFATIETFGTKDESTIGSPIYGLTSPERSSDSVVSSPSFGVSKVSPQQKGAGVADTKEITLPKIDVLAISPTPRHSNKKSASKLMGKLPKIPAKLLTKTLRRRKRSTESPIKDPSIELICNQNESFIQQLTPPISKSRNPSLLPGVKIAVPLLPISPDDPKRHSASRKRRKERFQMATVVSSKRICVYEKNNMPQSGNRVTNCLSITVHLDKCFLRNGQFATMTLRIMDKWGPKYMPKHSKLPMGSCVATSFGLGVLVGWRVEDDVHIVRSLWQHRGSGSACAYLQRDSIHATMEAAVGFDANTTRGRGTVVGYSNGGPEFKSGRYFVFIKEEGRFHKQVVELNRTDVLSCESAKFIPIVEHIRAAAQYQLQIDRYEELRDANSNEEDISTKMWGEFSKHFDTLWKSFLKAIEEDHEFDDGMNEFVQKCINFLNQLDAPGNGETPISQSNSGTDIDGFDASIVIHTTDSSNSQQSTNDSSSISPEEGEKQDTGFWLMNNMFDIFNPNRDVDDVVVDNEAAEGIEVQCTPRNRKKSEKNYARAFAMLRTLTRTVTNAKAASADEPSFKIAMAVCHELLLFIKTVIKVQQKNMNHESLQIWRKAWSEIVSVFGPVQRRLSRIGEGIAERMEKHGRRAKARILRFVDIIVQDDVLFAALEQGDWTRCAQQFEIAIVQAKIIDEQSREHYRKTAQFLYNHFASLTSKNDGAAARNNEKLEKFLKAIQVFANPRKALLELFLQDSVLDVLERIFVRAFSKEELASRMLNIHCSNFQSLRQFRMLKDFTIAGKLWIPLLDAADEEFAWAVSKLPTSAQEYLSPISSLFSLCVVQFHKMDEGDLRKDWLDFMMEEEAADIIHDLDMKLIIALEQFSRDVKDTMVVLPYYPSIDVDILNLVDDINIDAFVMEAAVALEDEGMLRKFIMEKATIMVERFLDYLPKIAIPVEKRDLGEGWTLTCRGAGGGDLTLTELIIKRENLTCQVMGGDSLLFPAVVETLDELEDGPTEGLNFLASPLSLKSMPVSPVKIEETSILNVIKEIVANARKEGCYQSRDGGALHPPTDKYAASVLGNLPVSSVLNCAIDLWRNLEIDDDELLEVAIRDISYQIQLKDSETSDKENSNEIANGRTVISSRPQDHSFSSSPPPLGQLDTWQISNTSGSLDESGEAKAHRFNPRVDPTVLFLEIKKLTFNLENFLFRIEKHESKKTIFDPAFEGTGSILVKNVLIKLRVQCFKGYVAKSVGRKIHRTPVPVLQLSDLEVSLEQVQMVVQDTGADWLLNRIVEGFGDRFTEIISSNLCDQVRNQVEEALDNINGYFEENPEVLLGVLDISIDDLDEMTVFV